MKTNRYSKLVAKPIDRGPLNYGQDFLAIPGPSVIPAQVLREMSHPMLDIYAGELVEISVEILEKLPGIAKTAGHPFILIANGHGAWQMAINNTMSRGDKVLVLESGRFASIWGQIAKLSGVDVEFVPTASNAPVDLTGLEERLAADENHTIKAVLAVQTDTASSVRNDIAAIRAVIDAVAHPAWFMVDCIASLGAEPYWMDDWKVDLTVGATQKGLMTPPGLGFVWVTDQLLEQLEGRGNDLKTDYMSWDKRLDPEAHYSLYGGTPPISHLYGLREALAMIEREGGLEKVWNRHAMLASVVWAAIEAWSHPEGVGFNIENPEDRSTAVTTVRTGSIDPDRLRASCQQQGGVTLGLGIGGFEYSCFRIGHMGHLNPPMILGTLGVVEAALLAIDAPMGGSGLAAAAARLAELFD